MMVVSIRSATTAKTMMTNKLMKQKSSSSLSSLTAEVTCDLTCDIDSQCYANANEIQSCLSSIPFNKVRIDFMDANIIRSYCYLSYLYDDGDNDYVLIIIMMMNTAHSDEKDVLLYCY